MMNERELNRVKVLAQIDDGRLTVANGDLKARQAFRLLKRYRLDGASGIAHIGVAMVDRIERASGRWPHWIFPRQTRSNIKNTDA